MFTQSSVYLVAFVSPLSTAVSIINNYKMGSWWSQSQFLCWITSFSNPALAVFSRFLSVMSFPASFVLFFWLTSRSYVVVFFCKSTLCLISGSTAETEECCGVEVQQMLMSGQNQGLSLQSEFQQSFVLSLLWCVQHCLRSPIIRDCYFGVLRLHVHKCSTWDFRKTDCKYEGVSI